ncbi:MAG: transcriptional regulator [Pseudomonadota bacterium]|nr:transcriptional regulator [Pseudomonadota bacterium]
MFMIIETPTFTRLWSDYWTEEERGNFASWLAKNSETGDVIPGTNGIRKVRWSRKGMGKRGGVRVVYYNRIASGQIWLLTIYAKSANENIPANILRTIAEEIESVDV